MGDRGCYASAHLWPIDLDKDFQNEETATQNTKPLELPYNNRSSVISTSLHISVNLSIKPGLMYYIRNNGKRNVCSFLFDWNIDLFVFYGCILLLMS